MKNSNEILYFLNYPTDKWMIIYIFSSQNNSKRLYKIPLEQIT